MFDCGNCCENLPIRERFNRNTFSSILAGIIFAVGWWVIIDCTCQGYTTDEFNRVFYIIGSIGTVAMILVNSVSNAQVRGDSYGEGCCSQVGARILLFIAFLMAFGSLIGGSWILFAEYIPKHKTIYPGIAIFLHNLAIFISTLILKFGRKEDRDL